MPADQLEQGHAHGRRRLLAEPVDRHQQHQVASGLRRSVEPAPHTPTLAQQVPPIAKQPLLELGHGDALDREVTGEQARGLELSICRLAEQEEPRILCQALAAVATLRADWAEPIAIAALARPEMAVKQEAALALAQVGSARAITTLVGWLAHHDNRGLREALIAALKRAAGPSLVAVLVDTLAQETELRRISLVWDALSGRLPLAAALRLARSREPAHQALLAACLEGQVKLADGETAVLAAQLRRARLLPRPVVKDPGRALRVDGFAPEAARALMKQRTPTLESEVLATVRVGLTEWIAWLRIEADAEALALVLEAAQAQHVDHVGGLLEQRLQHRRRARPEARREDRHAPDPPRVLDVHRREPLDQLPAHDVRDPDQLLRGPQRVGVEALEQRIEMALAHEHPVPMRREQEFTQRRTEPQRRPRGQRDAQAQRERDQEHHDPRAEIAADRVAREQIDGHRAPRRRHRCVIAHR